MCLSHVIMLVVSDSSFPSGTYRIGLSQDNYSLMNCSTSTALTCNGISGEWRRVAYEVAVLHVPLCSFLLVLLKFVAEYMEGIPELLTFTFMSANYVP